MWKGAFGITEWILIMLKMSNKKHKNLTLEEKVQVIEASEVHKLSVRKIRQLFECGKTQVYDALKRKNEIKSEWLKGHGHLKRLPKKTDNEEVNKLVWEWFVLMRSKDIMVSGSMLQARAKELAHDLGNTNFKASNGWLECFKNRHNINWSQIRRESNNVVLTALEEWKLKVTDLITGYDPKDIFAGADFDLLFHELHNQTRSFRDEELKGENDFEEKLTIFLCGNMIGEILKPLVIGSEEKPNSFFDQDISALPIVWHFNQNSCMTPKILEEWLLSFSNKMQMQNRNVILFLNDGACNPQINLLNVKLAWLPTNAVFVKNPMANGIFSCIKTYYHNLFMQSVTFSDQGSDLVNESKKIPVLQVLAWLAEAISSLKPEVIQKCFHDAAFRIPPSLNESLDLSIKTEVIKQEIGQICTPFGEAVENYVSVGDEVHKVDNSMTAECPVSTIQFTCSKVDADGCDHTESNSEDINSYSGALNVLEKLIKFSLVNNEQELLECLFSAKSTIERRLVS